MGVIKFYHKFGHYTYYKFGHRNYHKSKEDFAYNAYKIY